jgi:CRP-like cAMP-binding protein
MLSVEEKIICLRSASSLAKLADDQLKILAGICAERSFLQGETIFRQGEAGGALYIVLEGKVAIEREIQKQTDSVSIMLAKPFDSLGEMSLFYDAPNSVTATAMKDTQTLLIKNDDFIAYAKQFPEMLVELCQVLSKRLFEAYDKISEVTQNHKPRELRKLYDKLDF